MLNMGKKKILIVGGSGQLGNALLETLRQSFDVFGTYVKEGSERLIHLDITNRVEVTKVLSDIKPDIVINTSAMTHVDRCEDSPELAEEINVKGNENLVKFCNKLGSKLIFISTYYVFDGSKKYYSEEDMPSPLNIYAKTKLKAEQITLRNKNNLVVRPSKIYSYGYDNRNFLARIISSLKHDEETYVTNDQFNNPISSEDLAAAIKRLIECNANGIYHAGGPDYVSNYDFALSTAKVFQFNTDLLKPQTSNQFKAKAKRPKECVLVTDKLIKKTGFKPKSIETNLNLWKENESGERLRREILGLVEKFYDANIAKKKIEPGIDTIPPSGKKFDAEEIKLLVEAALDCWWTEGRFTKQFERKFKEFMGVKHTLITNSGSSANLLAFMTLTSKKIGERRIRKGDEVITVAAAFPTTVNPIIQAGCIPVFLDIDRKTCNIDYSKLEEAITDKTKAIFIAHTLGNPFNLNKIVEVAKKNKLWLIEDCCDALGSKYDGKLVGSFGDIATFSFYPAHHITMGEGGAIITNNNIINKEARSLRDWGRDCCCMPGCDNTCGKRFELQLGKLPKGYDHKYIYSNLGYNLKATDMQAAIGAAQLEKLGDFIEKRKENFTLLRERLKKFENYFQLPVATENSEPSWFGFLITLKENCEFSRKDLITFLNRKKIGTRLLFTGNITKQPYFIDSDVNYRQIGNLENTDYIMNNSFWIGVYPGITKEMIDYVGKTFEEYINKIENDK